MRIEYVEQPDLREQLRLVEIAHETNDPEIRRAALIVLEKYSRTLVQMLNDDEPPETPPA
jgi:hypothetical protein